MAMPEVDDKYDAFLFSKPVSAIALYICAYQDCSYPSDRVFEMSSHFQQNVPGAFDSLSVSELPLNYFQFRWLMRLTPTFRSTLLLMLSASDVGMLSVVLRFPLSNGEKRFLHMVRDMGQYEYRIRELEARGCSVHFIGRAVQALHERIHDPVKYYENPWKGPLRIWVAITEPDGTWHDLVPTWDVGVHHRRRFEGPYKSIFVPLADEWMASTVCVKWKSWAVLENTGLTNIVPLTTYVLASSPNFTSFIGPSNSVAFLNMRKRGLSVYDFNIFNVLFSGSGTYLYTVVASMCLFPVGRNNRVASICLFPVRHNYYPIVNQCRSGGHAWNWEISPNRIRNARFTGQIIVQFIDSIPVEQNTFGDRWNNTSFVIPVPSIPKGNTFNQFNIWSVDSIPDEERFDPDNSLLEAAHLSAEEAALATLATNEAAAEAAAEAVVVARVAEIWGDMKFSVLCYVGFRIYSHLYPPTEDQA
jgi:hypothetical protein